MEIVSWDQDSNIMLVSEEAFIKSIGPGIQEGMQITIIIFTMSRRTRVSTGEVRNQMSRSKSIWMDRRIPILEDIIDTERKEIVEGLFK
jgi:hypoxanthine-guanine phosphoribosyltransferase